MTLPWNPQDQTMTLLVTGASGLLGANLIVAALGEGRPLVAVSRTRRVHLPGVRSYCADLSAPGEAEAIVAEVRPRVVIHAAAATSVDGCEGDPAGAHRLNETMASYVATAARAVRARLIHISTEAVFDGTALRCYAEDDPTLPCNVYGQSKRAGEEAVLTADPDALIVRTTIYGWNAQAKASLAEFFIERLRRGEQVPGFADVLFTPILVNDLADRLLRLAFLDVRGILHVAGRECVSKVEFGQRLARWFGLDPALVVPGSVRDAGLPARRALRPCLCVARAEALLGRLPTVDEGIARFHGLEKDGLPGRLHRLLEEGAPWFAV